MTTPHATTTAPQGLWVIQLNRHLHFARREPTTNLRGFRYSTLCGESVERSTIEVKEYANMRSFVVDCWKCLKVRDG